MSDDNSDAVKAALAAAEESSAAGDRFRDATKMIGNLANDVYVNATLADIVAEMRRGTRLPGYWRSCDLNKILKYHADRIEAALSALEGGKGDGM